MSVGITTPKKLISYHDNISLASSSWTGCARALVVIEFLLILSKFSESEHLDVHDSDTEYNTICWGFTSVEVELNDLTRNNMSISKEAAELSGYSLKENRYWLNELVLYRYRNVLLDTAP